jgi:hypothetical protein
MERKTKMERRESARERGREKSRSKTSSKPAMADYILSRAPRQPGRSRPSRPVLIGKMGGNGRETGRFLFSFSFGSLLFFFQCLGNSLVKWGRS